MRRIVATILSVFAAIVFLYTAAAVYDSRFGVPDGLTGGRPGAALPGKSHLQVTGGFVRSVEGTRVQVRSLAPQTVLTFENRGKLPASCDLEIVNLNPLALRVEQSDSENSDAASTAPEFETSGPVSIRLGIELPAGTRRTLTVSHSLEEPGQVRFFVFGHIRNGPHFFRELRRIAAEEQPDFMIALGDSYYRAFPDRILELDRQLAETGVPTYLIRGEIEYREQNDPSPADSHPIAHFHTLDRHPAWFGSGNQSFEWAGWRFVTLENGRERNAASMNWLQNLPASDAERDRTLLFSHIPPFDPRTVIGKNVSTGSPREHKTVLREMRRLDVAAAFFDHYRWYDEREVEGVPAYVTSATVDGRVENQYPHFLDVVLSDAGIQVNRRSLLGSHEDPDSNDRAPDTDSNSPGPSESAL